MLSSTEEINKYIDSCNKLQYKQSVKNLKDIYRDAWDYIIEEEMAVQFSRESWSKMRLLITKEMNILKRVVNTISMVYMNPAKREALVNEEQDAVYQSILDKLPMNNLMRTINRMTSLTNATLARVVWRDGIDIDVVNFDNAEIILDPSDWKKIIGVKVYIGYTIGNDGFYPEKYREGYLYTLDHEYFAPHLRGKVIKFKSDGKGGDIFGEGEDNPYYDQDGKMVLPFVLFLRSFPVDCLIDYTTGSDLMDININTAISLAHINNLIKYQSWKQLYAVVNGSDKMPPAWEVGPETIIKLEGNRDFTPSVGTIDLQSNITALYDVIMKRVANVIAQYGIDQDSFMRTGSPQSGYALKVKKEGLLELREEQLPMYRHSEGDLFNKIRIVNNYHSTKKISDAAEFKIDFGDMTFPVSEQEENAAWIIKLSNNVVNLADWVQAINPDLTEDEALAAVDKNRKINSDSGFTAITRTSLNNV